MTKTIRNKRSASGREYRNFTQKLITNANSNHEIAATLFVTEGTVKFHVYKILAK